jgi:hypothetical protein
VGALPLSRTLLGCMCRFTSALTGSMCPTIADETNIGSFFDPYVSYPSLILIPQAAICALLDNGYVKARHLARLHQPLHASRPAHCPCSLQCWGGTTGWGTTSTTMGDAWPALTLSSSTETATVRQLLQDQGLHACCALNSDTCCD